MGNIVTLVIFSKIARLVSFGMVGMAIWSLFDKSGWAYQFLPEVVVVYFSLTMIVAASVLGITPEDLDKLKDEQE